MIAALVFASLIGSSVQEGGFLQANHLREVHHIKPEALQAMTTDITDEPTIYDYDGAKQIEQIVRENGYALETYEITTDDGYILTLHRIPGLLSERDPVTGGFPEKPAVLIMHGLTGDSSEFVLNAPHKAIAFMVSREGFDVWLGNNRGTTYSMKHVSMTYHQKKFWDFSFEEMGVHDVPAIVDFILGKTGLPKISLVGHSQGATQMLAAMPLIPEYFERTLNLFVGLGPASRLTNADSPGAKTAAKYVWLMELILVDLLGEFSLYDKTWIDSVKDMIKQTFFPKYFTSKISDFDVFPDIDELRRGRSLYGHLPGGAGYRTMFHYLQEVLPTTFKRYDYGEAKNMEKYGQPTPPDFELTQSSRIPIALLGGDRDIVATEPDCLWLAEQLGSERVILQKTYKDKGHLTYVLGADMTYFTDDVMPLLHEYETAPL